ncbi:hypothetical protein CEXT_155891 [Caerostris extrusa]|uniref:Secreted protein n=1 Tax=Caerostris extrusa TaxID=172846 RepID=A0AAV4QD87_CAEEX|nr:hypothetical protein CEXT_155891 [Caerostris extrusa]
MRPGILIVFTLQSLKLRLAVSDGAPPLCLDGWERPPLAADLASRRHRRMFEIVRCRAFLGRLWLRKEVWLLKN